jgi:DNA-binding XRE family transcriptional regulator
MERHTQDEKRRSPRFAGGQLNKQLFQSDTFRSEQKKPTLRDEARKLAAQGLKRTIIAKRLGVSYQRISQVLNADYRRLPRALPIPFNCQDCGQTFARVHPRYRNQSPKICPLCLPNHREIAFGSRLRLMRLARGMTQSDLAARVLTSWTLISMIERGVHTPSLKLLTRLARVLGSTILITQT